MKNFKRILLACFLVLSAFVCFFSLKKNTVSVNALEEGQTLDTNIDTISIADLTIDGLTNQSAFPKMENTNTTFSGYSTSNTNKSLVLKFKYDLVDETPTDVINMRIHFHVAGDQWNTDNSFMIRGDNVFLNVWNGTKFTWATSPRLTKGLYNLEMGRIAILDEGGAATGNYYVYFKINDTEVLNGINPYTVANIDNAIFFNIGTNDKNQENGIYDINYTYEEPQYLSVSDLKSGGNSVGKTLSTRGLFTFDTTNATANNSVVFIADVDYKTQGDSQIYITKSPDNPWNQEGYIWFQKDRVYFGVNDANGTFTTNKEVKYRHFVAGSGYVNYSLEAGSQHNIEYGRLAIMNGDTFTGRYHVYFKLDGKLVYGFDQAIKADIKAADSIRFTGTAGAFDYLDAYKRETPKEISVSDLKQNGTSIGDAKLISANGDYQYDNSDHTDNYSIKFGFFFEALDPSENQFHFTNFEKHWDSASSFILKSTTVHVGKSKADNYNYGWTNADYTFAKDGLYYVEFGRLADMIGTHFRGTYYTYLKINGQIVTDRTGNIIPYSYAAANNLMITKTSGDAYINKIIDKSSNIVERVATPTGFVSVADGTKVTLPSEIVLYKENPSIIEFDSNYEQVTVTFNPVGKLDTRATDKVTLKGTYVFGNPTDYYHYTIDVSEINAVSGYENSSLASMQFRSAGDYTNLKITGNDISSIFETADEISIGDLKVGGNLIGDVATLSAHTTYTYTATAAHKSVVYKFDYEVLGTTPKSQFHFNTGWTGDNSTGMIWFTDSIHLRKNATPAAYVSVTNPMNAAGTYNVEIGKLYITSGTNTGCYYIYAKVDGVLLVDYLSTEALPDAAGLFTTGTNGDKLYDIDYVPTVNDENPDVISISDLTVGGKTNLSVLSNVNQGASYTKENANGSLVYKFQYEVNDTTDTDSIAVRVHFDVVDNDEWNSDCALWIRGDGVYLSKYTGTEFGWSKKDALTAGKHEIEFGRLAILANNVPTGNYYLYYKVDGVEINAKTIAYDLSKMDNTLFINFSAGNTMNKMYDIDYVEPEFEVADEISVSELRVGGYLVGNQVVLDQHQAYSYDADAAHKSVVFNFLYEAKQAEFGCQVHFTNTWIGNQAGMIWLQNGTLHISKDSTDGSAQYVSVTSPFTAPGIYDVEIGKLYYSKGVDQGKYYIYLKVNGTLIADTIAASMPDNNCLFTTGNNGDVIYDVNYMPVDVESDLYIYKWNANKSGIQFEASLNKAYVDYRHVSEAGFILVPQENYNGSLNINSNNAGIIKMAGKLVEDGSNYVVKAAIASLKQENIASKYVAVAYIKMDNAKGEGTVYSYSDACVTSFYEELQDLTGASEAQAAILNGIKAKVLVATIDEDDCAVTGATKTGDFDATSIVLTGENAEYYAYILNGKALRDEEVIMIGYRSYQVALGANTITLTKQDTDLVYGVSEHFHELNSGIAESSNAVSLAPMTSNIGLTTVRFDLELSRIFSVKENDKLVVNKDEVLKTQAVLDELKANGGVTEFLAVLWVVQPYNCYAGGEGLPAKNNTAPNPTTQAEEYLRWLNINSEAAKLAAKLFPDVKAFETWNEAEFNNMLVQNDGTAYDLATKTRILTDLMYYYRKGIKEANPDAVLTTNSLCCYQQTGNSDFACTSQDFLRALYAAIKDTTPVTGYTEVDTDANNYFDIINIHPYTQLGTTVSNWKSFVEGFSAIACDNDDDGTEVWITEFGFSEYTESNGNQAKLLQLLAKAEEIDSLTRLYFYLVHDDPNSYGGTVTYWGFYNVDGTIKEVGTAVKNFIAEQA